MTYTLRYRQGSFAMSEEFDSLTHAIAHAEILALAGKGSMMSIDRGQVCIMDEVDLRIAWREREARSK